MSAVGVPLHMCDATKSCEDGLAWACTEPRDHQGDHIARGYIDGRVLDRWENDTEDDGTEAESLAEVSVPAFPDVMVHGRAHASAA